MITSREQLKQYVLRALGEPVIQVNIAEEQLDDRIDEAIAYYNMYHYDGVERLYLKHQITEGDKVNKYIELPENVKGVARILSLSSNTSNQLLNYETQFRLSQVANLHTATLSEYQMTMNNLQMIDSLLSGQTIMRFNKNDGKLHIDYNWDKLVTDNYFIVDCYAVINPEISIRMYNDIWLKSYLITLVKRQWGQNLLKYEGVQLPGGVTLSGQNMYDTAVGEQAALEQQAINESGMLDMFIG
jgi:hypothetical protein